MGVDYRQAFFLYTALLKLTDTLAVVVAWHLCWTLRFQWALFPIVKGLPEYKVYARASLPLAIVFLIAMHLIGAYRPDRIPFGFRAFKKLLHGAVLGTLIFVSAIYFQSSSSHYSRVYMILFMGVTVVVMTTGRLLAAVAWDFVQPRLHRLRTLVVGNGELLELYLTQFEKNAPYPVEWVGRLGKEKALPKQRAITYFGEPSAILPAIEATGAEQVILSFSTDNSHEYAPILEKLSHEMVTVKVIPDYGRFSTFTYHASDELGVPLLYFNQPPVGGTDRFLKRAGDFIGALAFIILFSPLFLIISILVRLSSPGPIIYSQRRVGADGVEFDCYKFRSMRKDAENETGPVWAQKNDDRVTPVGAWLRRTSLDELPQFFNILKGDMSIVGPRPERPNFVRQFRGEVPKYMLRHRMKSGITGWAQVNGLRGNTSLEKRIQYDLYYIGHWSHLFDIKIITVTPWILLKAFRKGVAY